MAWAAVRSIALPAKPPRGKESARSASALLTERAGVPERPEVVARRQPRLGRHRREVDRPRHGRRVPYPQPSRNPKRLSSHVVGWRSIAVDGTDWHGGNCTRSLISASLFQDSNLRVSPLSLAAPQHREPGTDRHDLAAIDARLARLCAAWTSLPEHVILAILALVDSADVVEADRLQPSPRDSRGHRPNCPSCRASHRDHDPSSRYRRSGSSERAIGARRLLERRRVDSPRRPRATRPKRATVSALAWMIVWGPSALPVVRKIISGKSRGSRRIRTALLPRLHEVV